MINLIMILPTQWLYVIVYICSLEPITRFDVDQLPKDNGRSITYYKQNNNCMKLIKFISRNIKNVVTA